MSCTRKDPLACLLAEHEGVLPVMPEGIVIIVENDPAKVEKDLAAGVAGCPVCGGRLARWGWARQRWLRCEAGPVELRPRRGRCVSCLVTQVFLPDVALGRRVDAVAVIGRALMAAAAGAGHRKAAELVGRAASTVRGWVRRFRVAALRVASHFTTWAHRLDPNLAVIAPAGSALADAVEAVGVAGRAASLRLGPRPGWSWASALTAGRLLSNTNSPWPAP